MELDGLRAWIGLVERKLTMRTRVFLVLVAIAVGGAGAAIYLAIDARNTAVSESDLQTARDELAAQIAGGGAANLIQLEAEVTQLKSEVEALSSGSAKEKGTKEAAPKKEATPNGDTGGAQTPNDSPKALLESLKGQAQ
ncbi:MAG TPA: hypothetical protein VF245_10585 [Solirubrobacterales bacterium]